LRKEGRKMRTLSIGLMVLGLMGIALVGVTSPASPVNKVVIGVLDFETSGDAPDLLGEKKKALMKELRRNTRVKLVSIRESCGLTDLKKHGYERAERYKKIYHLDMILHSHITFPGGSEKDWHAYFSLIDLYTNKIKEASIETVGMPIEVGFRDISKKLQISGDINRVLRAKKEALAKKEVAVRQEVKESPEKIETKKKVSAKKEVTDPWEFKGTPEEIEGFLIQNGPRLIVEGEHDPVLELIEDLPRKRRRHVQVQTLGCFANLKGWVCDRDKSCKLGWWKLRNKLMNSGNSEATPMLVIFLKDKEPYVRIYAAELLGHIGDKRALKHLRAVGENDENRKVRKYAKKAYEQISGEKF
jgi:hypothetical protein